MRAAPFVEDQYYHIFNRGVDKRNIFSDTEDLVRFFQSMELFNSAEPIGSIFEVQKSGQLGAKHPTDKKAVPVKRLVEFVAYCLNPNHFHFILRQLAEGGISEFMKRLGGGYTNYFNERYKRAGALFQGTFKSKLIDSDQYFLRLATYVNLNFRVHEWGSDMEKLTKSSWNEYIGESHENFCNKEMILDQFKNHEDYKKFALEDLKDIVARKREDREWQSLLVD
ncbi:MAG TPA: transposase [Candidatus Paceibacterota bacterium]